MPFEGFVQNSGLKLLAVAKLNQTEYSVALYLLNCSASGLDQFITTHSELASLVGCREGDVIEALANLSERNIVKLHYGDKSGVKPNQHSVRIGIEYDVDKWRHDLDKEITHHDAIVFPFRRKGEAVNFAVLDGQKEDDIKEGTIPTWKRVFDLFLSGRSLDQDEMDKAEEIAKVLVETHPVDQVLLMCRHFGLRIPTLSLLASSWQHYQEVFEEETQKVDMLGARQKHIELDEKLRDQVRALLEDTDDDELSVEERNVLEILKNHRHPRRQLFWAYQLRSRYKNLANFFADNHAIMLPVTTKGHVVRKGPGKDS